MCVPRMILAILVLGGLSILYVWATIMAVKDIGKGNVKPGVIVLLVLWVFGPLLLWCIWAADNCE